MNKFILKNPSFYLSHLPQENEIEKYFDLLWPLCRSLTGEGIRSSLKILSEIIPLQFHHIHSGTEVFDWKVPKEWNIKDAYILDPQGNKIVDFKENNLHVVGYSTAVDKDLSLDDLQKHLHSIEDLPEAIPYVTSYYNESWGFCISHRQRKSLKPGNYRVVISSSLENGKLTYGDLVLPSTQSGEQKEILISTYVCHPSMANNELSGPLVSAFLYRLLSQLPERKFNYRFFFGAETIGSIAYLSQWGEHFKKNLAAGLVMTCCGDHRKWNYKQTRDGGHTIDRICENLLTKNKQLKDVKIRKFFPLGSDERQYCSPGFNLPMGSMIRSMYGEYPEYHTSLDNKDFISFGAMVDTIDQTFQALMALEMNQSLVSTNPFCEPMLGKRNLYSAIGGPRIQADEKVLINWILNFSDGKHDLVAIANKAEVPVTKLYAPLRLLVDAGLVKEA